MQTGCQPRSQMQLIRGEVEAEVKTEESPHGGSSSLWWTLKKKKKDRITFCALKIRLVVELEGFFAPPPLSVPTPYMLATPQVCSCSLSGGAQQRSGSGWGGGGATSELPISKAWITQFSIHIPAGICILSVGGSWKVLKTSETRQNPTRNKWIYCFVTRLRDICDQRYSVFFFFSHTGFTMRTLYWVEWIWADISRGAAGLATVTLNDDINT